MKLTKRHIGNTVRIQGQMLGGVLRRCWNSNFGVYMGAGGCELTFSILQQIAVIASLSNDKTRCLIHWRDSDASMWIDADLIERTY